MKLGIAIGLALIWLMGTCQPANAADWTESREVRDRLDRLRARSAKPSPVASAGEEHLGSQEAGQKSENSWRHIAYDAILPVVPPKKNDHSQDRKMEVAEADRLGYQLNNPAMREKVLGLYRMPGVVVEQYVIGQ